ncbi:hypothetical protein MCAP1_003523 [Malassezia caprae]|uniref:Zn(2)-C6 fungal-type domain-containing protein n=1 Tax=Malassezia caprae TaxID=1381934 RepID=A0AAF0IXN8_9BASI|nr:hypothetical protein MCAP1_003523 [Malassezia caprae]
MPAPQDVAPGPTLSTTAPPPRKRSKALSCDSCRRRKLKCDRGWPCGACCDRNEQHLCTWGDGVVPERTGRDTGESGAILQRLNLLESKLDRILERMDGTPTPTYAAPCTPPDSISSHTVGWDLHCTDMLGCTEADTRLRHRREALEHMFKNLPEADVLSMLTHVFITEIKWMSTILSERRAQELLSEITALREQVGRHSSYIQRLNLEQVTHLIYVLAICFSVCGMALLAARDPSYQIAMEGRVPTSHMRYFQEVLFGLRTMDTLEEPTMEFVIAMVIVISAQCASRPAASAASLVSQTVQVALLLGLDEEPPDTMPFEEASCRVHLYSILCIHDWFLTTFIKRRPLIISDAKKLPSVFGTMEQRSKFLSCCQQMKLEIAHLYCRSSLMMMPSGEDYAYVQELHTEAMTLQCQAKVMWDDPDEDDESPNSLKQLQRTFGVTSLHYFMIRIHLPYYMRGWDDKRYELSRDACFSSARALLRLFREAFSWKMPKNETGQSCESFIPTDFPIVSRMWFFCHWCTAAAVLLLKHLTLLNERNEQPSWDHERESIVQDLCIMSRLLNYLAPVSTIAREGYDAMQRVAAHIMQTDFDTSHAGLDNCVTHWADRILPARCSQRPKTEPMMMLKSLVRNNDFSVSHMRTETANDRSSSSSPTEPLSNPPSIAPVSGPGLVSSTSPLSGMASSVSTIPTSDLDTFWAKFAVPPGGYPIQQNVHANTLPVPNELPAPSSFLLPPQNLMHMAADVSPVLYPKDMLMANPLNFNVGNIGPFTDDFIRSLDDYAKSGPHATSLPLP